MVWGNAAGASPKAAGQQTIVDQLLPEYLHRGRREGWRERGREEGRKGGRERGRKGGREGGREEGREGERKEGREEGREGGRGRKGGRERGRLEKVEIHVHVHCMCRKTSWEEARSGTHTCMYTYIVLCTSTCRSTMYMY